MKYIRTNNKIYDVDDLYVCEGLTDKPYATKDGNWCVYKRDIVKEADTIEELCDEFVIKPSFSKAFLHDEDKQPLKSVKQKAIEIGCFEIFGAIWTDKGLIYVAKMNNKGELENGK